MKSIPFVPRVSDFRAAKNVSVDRDLLNWAQTISRNGVDMVFL